MRSTITLPWFFAVLLIITAWPAAAQWEQNPILGTRVCTEVNRQDKVTIAQDGSGGALLAWVDERSSTFADDIYVQRLDNSGFELWAADGVVVCNTPTTNCDNPRALSDGAGGAFIVWEDFRVNIEIYIQRVDSNGNMLWAANGVNITSHSAQQRAPRVISDGTGGVIVLWRDYRTFSHWDLYAQRVDGLGNTLWAAGGVPVCLALQHQENPMAIPDGSGGMIAVWEDYRTVTSWDIYAQRIDTTGAPVWTVDGIPVSTAINHQVDPVLVSDGAGGAIIAWDDQRNGSPWIVHAQRIDSTGSPVWTPDGIPLSAAPNFQLDPAITTDGAGGAIIAWTDVNTGNHDILAQRLDGSGTALWAVDGTPVCTEPDDQNGTPQIVASGAGGAIITWQDHRNSPVFDQYGQRLDGSGALLWAASGVPFSAAYGYQEMPAITSDGADGAILAWTDRISSDRDLYAQRIDSDGIQGGITPSSTVVPAIDCTPEELTLPNSSTFTVSLTNTYLGQTRRMAARININLASGASVSNWRGGYTNIAAGASYVTTWNQNFPALGSLVGDNEFVLVAEDVTPAPFNQPPYPPAGDADSHICTVTGLP